MVSAVSVAVVGAVVVVAVVAVAVVVAVVVVAVVVAIFVVFLLVEVSLLSYFSLLIKIVFGCCCFYVLFEYIQHSTQLEYTQH